MTALELWCFACITCTFGALLSYVIILVKIEYTRCYEKMHQTKPGLEVTKDKRDLHIEVFLFTCTAGGFALINIDILDDEQSSNVKTKYFTILPNKSWPSWMSILETLDGILGLCSTWWAAKTPFG